MSNTETEISELRAKIGDLEVRLAKQADQHQRDVKALMGCDDVLDKHRKVNDAELADAFERIKQIELTLFPHLARDIANLNDVIGDDEVKAYNPLDFRDRRKGAR